MGTPWMTITDTPYVTPDSEYETPDGLARNPGREFHGTSLCFRKFQREYKSENLPHWIQMETFILWTPW